MLHTLIGEESFQQGMRLYFERFDGQAVTCEDFVRCMADASGRDLGIHALVRAGRHARATVRREYDPARQALTLEISQNTSATPGQAEKLPFHMPICMGLVGTDGAAQPLRLEGENEPAGTDRVLELKEPTQRFTFLGLETEPVPSLLRGFTAPAKLDAHYSDDDLAVLMAWRPGRVHPLGRGSAPVEQHPPGPGPRSCRGQSGRPARFQVGRRLCRQSGPGR